MILKEIRQINIDKKNKTARHQKCNKKYTKIEITIVNIFSSSLHEIYQEFYLN